MANLSTKIEVCLGKTVNYGPMNPDVVIVNNNKIAEWNLSDKQPTESELDAAETEANAREALRTVQNNRRKDYPSYGEQLDYIFHNGIEKWKTDIIQPIKDKYPKP